MKLEKLYKNDIIELKGSDDMGATPTRVFFVGSEVEYLDEERIKSALSHKTIKEWAYILHDRDKYTKADEDKQRKMLEHQWFDGFAGQEQYANEDDYISKNLTHKEGALKEKHWHIALRTNCPMEVDKIAEWFGIEPNFIELPKGRGAFIDCCEYLTHENEKQQALGKFLYPDSDIKANFDFRTEINNRNANRLKYGKNADKMTDGDILQLHVMQDGWSMRKCRQEDPLAYIKVRNKLPNLRLDYLLDQPPQPFRLSIYVDGAGGLGKGSICQYLAERLFPEAERPCFVVGNDPRVAFDGYDGEPVLIWEDYRAYKFISNFTREGTFAIFDSHPKVQSQQVKNSRIVLQNYVNIVNGIEPYADFLDGLAGEYVDKEGKKHIAEDKDQATRRFQQILCIREDEFDILFNRGFVDKNSHLYKQFDMYERVRGSMSKAMQNLEGAAKQHTLIDMSQPAVDCYRMIEASHEDKITEVADLPEEFKHIEHLSPTEAYAEDAKREAERKCDELLEMLFKALDEFVNSCRLYDIDNINKRLKNLDYFYEFTQKNSINSDTIISSAKMLGEHFLREYLTQSFADEIMSVSSEGVQGVSPCI